MKSLVTAATLLVGLAHGPAMAAEGAWLVGGVHIVRSGQIDLDTVAGRAAFLGHVERAAKAQCRNEETRGRRQRCAVEAIAAAMEGSSPRARQALTLALAQRDQPEMKAAALAGE